MIVPARVRTSLRRPSTSRNCQPCNTAAVQCRSVRPHHLRLADHLHHFGPCNNTASNTSIAITGAGKCTVTASAPSGPGPNNTTYSAASATQSFNISPAVLTVAAGNLTISYGQPIPSLTSDYTITGYVNSESSSVLNNTAPAISTTATSVQRSRRLPHHRSTGNLAATNYSFLYVRAR